jgi:hypothetical protein
MSRSAQNLEAALAACLDDLQAGMTPAQCLARHPEYADQLEPLLLTAERLQGQAWPALSTSGRVRGRKRMHAALASRRPAGFPWWSVLKPLLAAVVLLALAGGVWLAWPGRQSKTTDLPTSAPVVLQATPSPVLTLGPTATLTLTVTATPTGTAGGTNPVPTEADGPEVIERADGTETPFATATLRTRSTATSGVRLSTPGATLPGSPAATVEVTETRTPPDATSTRSKTREPERTPEPSRSAVTTEAPHATATREAPHATATHEPSPTAEPTESPQATATPAATKMSELSETPEPAKTPEAVKMPDHD